MDDRTNLHIRRTSEFVGFLFKFLSFLSIVATVIATIFVARLGNSLDLQTRFNPLAWVVLASGLFATLVLFAFGTLLHMTCVIYDRQDRPFRASAAHFKSPGGGSPTEPVGGPTISSGPTSSISAPESEPLGKSASSSSPAPPEAANVVTRPEPSRPSTPAKGKLWELLTKERKLIGG